jgi:hypothetical protein
MTTVYISSTYKDLVKHREAVAHILRSMRKIVLSMEDYTASDERPLNKCLADVAQCDIYIGIFAHRYGFIPQHDNPEGLSITELEFQQARKCNKPCLIFLLDEMVPWPLPDTDAYNGEADQGKLIKALRDRLNLEYCLKPFKSPEDLSASVSSAVSNLLENMQLGTREAEPDRKVSLAASLPREITSDLFLAFSDIDSGFASDFADYLNSHRLRLILDQRALLAASPDDFERLERSVRSCHSAAILVSDTSLRQLQERRRSVTDVFQMVEARTQQLFAVCLSKESAKKMAEWPLTCVECVHGWRPRETSAPRNLYARLEGLRLNTGLDSGKHWVGLPIIVVTMTEREATELNAKPALVEQKLGHEAYRRFMDIQTIIGRSRKTISEKYGARRHDCRPFEGIGTSISQLLNGIVERINDDQPFQLRGRLIKLQSYPFDELIHSSNTLGPIYTQLLSTGCVVIVDEYSLFHPVIQEALASSGLLANELVSLVTLSPANPYYGAPFDLLEAELRKRMAAAFNRFASIFDPQCELSVGDVKRLKRWLNSSLPYTIQSLRHPKPNRQNIAQFAREQGLDPQPRIGPLLYTKGGPL